MIPQELIKLNQWVVADANSKVPLQVGGYPASAVNPKTWDTYEHCKEWVDCMGGYLGFVFADNGIVGIDIDDAVTDGKLSGLAFDIFFNVNSYTEYSKSGTGLHLFVKGDIPFKGKNNGRGVEIYKTSRYFVMTGNSLSDTPIVENQKAIDYVLEKYFPEELRQSKENKINKFYKPEWNYTGSIPLHPVYPDIPNGCRNQSLTSLAGQLHTCGLSDNEIFKELKYANKKACKPMLADNEIKAIVKSITRYKRDG